MKAVEAVEAAEAAEAAEADAVLVAGARSAERVRRGTVRGHHHIDVWWQLLLTGVAPIIRYVRSDDGVAPIPYRVAPIIRLHLV